MRSTTWRLALLVALIFVVSGGGVAQATVNVYSAQVLDPNGNMVDEFYAGTNDARVYKNPDAPNSDTNFNNAGSLSYTRAHESNPSQFASFVRFDDLGIPAGATINSVTLKLYKVADFAYVDSGYDLPGVQMDVAGLMADFGAEGVGAVDTSPPEFAGVDGGPTANHRQRPDVQDTNTYIPWNETLALAAAPDYSLGSYDSTFDRGPVDASVTGILGPDLGYIDFDVTTSFTSQFTNNKMYGWVVHGDILVDVATDGQFIVRDSEFADANPLNITAPQLVVDFTATGGVDGDYNDSGLVEQGDLDLVLLNWGATWPPTIEGWVNQQPTDDGVVNQNDLDGVLLNWGNSAAVASAPVPEPASLALWIFGGLGLALASRRSR